LTRIKWNFSALISAGMFVNSMWLILAIAMFAVAVVFSMLGQGGGALYTPLQVWMGVEFHEAATTSLFLIMVTSVSASLVFHKAKRIDWPLAIVLETVTTAGGFAGGLGSAWLSGTTLTLVFAVVIGAAAVYMIRPMKEREACAEGPNGFLAWKRNLGGQIYCVNMALALPLSFFAGMLSGLVGVGGGLIKVPIMVLVLGVPMDIAVGSSALMVGLTATGGFGGHLVHGHWNWKLSLVLAIAVFIGGQLGSRLTVRLDKAKVKVAFGWFLVIISATMVFKVLL
jgi:uncharacterized membrane protein YfcA